jgi:hypothetical protein
LQVADGTGKLDTLQALLDEGQRRAGPFLRQTFEMPGHCLSAGQLVPYFSQMRPCCLATLSPGHEPRVTPVGAFIHDQRFYVPTSRLAMKVRNVDARSAVSLSHFVLKEIAVIAHGTAIVLRPDDPEFAEADSRNRAPWWEPLRADGSGAYLRLDPTHLYAWAQEPQGFPG